MSKLVNYFLFVLWSYLDDNLFLGFSCRSFGQELLFCSFVLYIFRQLLLDDFLVNLVRLTFDISNQFFVLEKIDFLFLYTSFKRVFFRSKNFLQENFKLSLGKCDPPGANWIYLKINFFSNFDIFLLFHYYESFDCFFLHF